MESTLKSQGYLYLFSKDSFRKSSPQDSNNSKSEIITTLIADDHPYLIHGVETDLNKDSKIKIVGTAKSYDEVILKTRELQPCIVLLDLRMPERDKYDLELYINNLKSISRCKVIIFSNETGWARVHRCLEFGAAGYIEKAISIGRLAEFIHRVHENDELLIFTAEKLPKIAFSKRQKEILNFVADGVENDDIGKRLGIDVKTVQTYVIEVREKFAEAFSIHPVKPRTLLLLASKLGFGNKTL